jgi:uroporphyrinogen-III synthase
MKTITFLREQSEEDDYEMLFANNGFNTDFIQLFDTRYINVQIFQEPPKFSKVIITSQKCVDMFAYYKIIIHQRWKELDWYCVGVKTAKKLFNCLNIEAKGKCPSSDALVGYIKEECPEYGQSLPMLYLTGDKTLGSHSFNPRKRQ